MPGQRRARRLAGLLAVLMMGGGLGGLAGPAAASAAAACPAWDGTQPPNPAGENADNELSRWRWPGRAMWVAGLVPAPPASGLQPNGQPCL